MSQSSRGKSSERIINIQQHSSSGIQSNAQYSSSHNQIGNNGYNNNNSLIDIRENQQKDLITEMKRLKKNFQDLKSPTVQKKYFGMNGNVQQQQVQQQNYANSFGQTDQQEQNKYNSYNYNSYELYNSNPLSPFQIQQNINHEQNEQIQKQIITKSYKSAHHSYSQSYNQPSKYQQGDSNLNHYISQDEDNSRDGELDLNNITQTKIGQNSTNINSSFNQNENLYAKSLPPSYLAGNDSSRSQGVNSSTRQTNQYLDKQYYLDKQLHQSRLPPKEYVNQLYSQQSISQQRQNNSLKRISDKINNIKDRAEKIEQIKSLEKKQYEQQNQQQLGSSFIYTKKETKNIQTDDIANIYVEKKQNDENLKEIERLREQLKQLEQELNNKEINLREQENALKIQMELKQQRIHEQDQQIEKVLDDLNRLQKENIKANNALKLAQENLALNGKNQNNTSSQLLLPSEFKSKWETLVTDGVANTFINFFENPIILTNLLQDLFITVHEISKNHIKDTNTKVMDMLQLDKKHSKVYEQNLQKLYQDFNNDIFKIIAESQNPRVQNILSKFKVQAEKIISHDYYSEFQNMKSDYIDEEEDVEQLNNDDNGQSITQKFQIFRETIFFQVNQDDFKQYLEELYESSELFDFIEQFYRLSIHMHLHDPPLSLPTQNFKNRVFEYVPYRKNNYYLIDGFVQQNAPALTVIPPVMRNNQIYTGIKSSVILLTEDFLNERIQSKIDASILKEQQNMNTQQQKDTQTLINNGENSGSKATELLNQNQKNNLKDQIEQQQSPKLQNNIKIIKQLTQPQENQTSTKTLKSEKDEKERKHEYQIEDFESYTQTNNKESNFNSNIDQITQNKHESIISEQLSSQNLSSNIQQQSDTKLNDTEQNNKHKSKDNNNKENLESLINQSIFKTSPTGKSINNLKNISQISQKFDSTKKSGYFNFGSIQSSPKQDLLNLISPRLDSSRKKIQNKEIVLNYSKNGSKVYDINSSCSSKKKINFESAHSEKKNHGLTLNKSGINGHNYIFDNGKEDLTKNLFLTSRPHYSKSQKQKDESISTSILNYSNKNILKGQIQASNKSEVEKRTIFDDLTNQAMFSNNIQQATPSSNSKFINRIENNNINFLKKGAFTGKNQSSISCHNTNTLSNLLNKKTQDSVSLLRTLQEDNKRLQNTQNYKDEEQYNDDLQDQETTSQVSFIQKNSSGQNSTCIQNTPSMSINSQIQNNNINSQNSMLQPNSSFQKNSLIQKNLSLEKNNSIERQQKKDITSPSSNRNDKYLNDSKLTFTNAVNEQDRSGLHSNNQSSQKLRRSNRSEEENRIINQNTIFNKHFKRNSIQNETLKNIPISSAQQTQLTSKPYTFNTFLENHRRNIQKNEKDQSQNLQNQNNRQESSSSSRDRLQAAISNITGSQKDQGNKQSFNTSRIYKKDSFELKSSTFQQNMTNQNIQKQTSFTKSPLESKIIDQKKTKQDDFYANLRKQINMSQQQGAFSNKNGNSSCLNVINNNSIKDPKLQPIKSSRDISPSSIQINCSKTDRNLKYSDISSHIQSNIGNYFPPDSLNNNTQKQPHQRTNQMKRLIQNFIDSFTSDDDNEDQKINKKQRDNDYIQDDSLIDELCQQRQNGNNSRLSSNNQHNKDCSKYDSNENRPFSIQTGLPLQTQHKKNKTFEKLYNDLKQKKSFTQNPIKANKEFLSKV